MRMQDCHPVITTVLKFKRGDWSLTFTATGLSPHEQVATEIEADFDFVLFTVEPK